LSAASSPGASTPAVSSAVTPRPADSVAALLDATARATPLVIFAAGDVNLGRAIGQRILHESTFDPFDDLRPLLSLGDVSFANLESPLSDQNGETEHPTKPLVFVGPPGGAPLVARAPFHVVSLANNHIWDYDERGFLDTLAALDGAGVKHAGAGRRAGEQFRPAVLEARGRSIALLAATHFFNPGDFRGHEAEDRVAWAGDERFEAAVRKARAEYDIVLVSYHGGKEYSDVPAQEPLDFAKRMMQAGADAVLAHHPHVPQGIGWFDERPVFYSLGNLVFGKNRKYPWTARGFIARLTISGDRRIDAAVCPYRIDQGVPRRAAGLVWPGWDGVFRARVTSTSSFASVRGTDVGPPDEHGCLPIRPGAGEALPAAN
jgi:poly-gamma-glutamate synthesis protein (capsule biosynthesis protein)